MSLQVWLPLNGDLHNQGLSNLTFINNTSNIVIDDNGKIGKCYTRGTVKTNGRIISNENILLDGDLSMCCWAKVTATVGDTANGLVSNHNASTNKGFGITVKQVSTSDYRICCSTGNGSSRTYYTYYGTTNIKGVWHHLALTYSHTKKQFQLWVDGKVEKTQSYTNSAEESKISIFNWNLGSDAANYHPACSLNDVRIYDHCLSDKEIEEISKGLILHYKLDQGNPNLLTKYVAPGQNAPGATATAGRTNYYGDYGIIIPASENADTYFRLFLKQQLTQGETYTISCYVSGLLPGTYYNFPLFAQGNTSMGVLQLNHNGLCSLTFTMNSSTQNATTAPDGSTVYICFMDDAGRALASGQGQIIVSEFKLEEGNFVTTWRSSEAISTIYDSSGYNNDGTIVGSLTAVADSARYNCSTFISNGATNYIQSPTLQLPGDQITINYWFKSSNTSPGSDYHMPMNSYTSQAYEMSIHKTGYLRGGLKVNGTRKVDNCTSTKLLNGDWHMCSMTYDGNIIKRYVDGVMEKSTSVTGTLDTSESFIFGHYGFNTSYYCVDAAISDARIYATALTEAQIQELYNTSATIDNLGNAYARELVE